MNRDILDPDTLRHRLAWLLIGLLLVLGGLPAVNAPFVYDDKIEVIGNLTIRMIEEWRAIASYNVSRPLLIWSYAWNFHGAGLDPFEYHVTNLVIAVLGVGAALWMGRGVGRLAGSPAPAGVAFFATLLWALHPMATEAVTYTTGRSESLCALFCFASLGATAAALSAERAEEGGAGWRALSLLAFFGAVTSKEVGAMVPAAALGMELLLGPPGPVLRRPRYRWYLPVVLLIGLAVALRLQQAGVLLPRESERSLGEQLTTAAFVWLRYLQLWLLPVGQTLFHHQQELSPRSVLGLLGIAGWLGVVGLGVGLGRRRPATAWALLCLALFLLPSSSVVRLKENMAEHRAFQTGLYLFLALGWALPAAAHRPLARALPALAAVLLALTVQRNRIWADEVRLWTEATERAPGAADAWYGLGDALRFAGRFSEGMTAYEAAIALDRDHLDAWNNLGIAKAELGDAAGAEAAWRGALARKPSYCKAHNNLGSLAYRQQRWELAIGELQSSLAYCPESAAAHYMLGNIYAGPRRDSKRAQLHYEAVLTLAPAFERAAEVKQRLLELTW